MSAAAVIPSLLPIFMVIAMRRAEARIHRQLSDAGAFTADSAIEFSPSRPLEKRRLQALAGAGAVRLTANSHYYIDADGWTKFQAARRRRALIAISIIAALFSVGVAVVFAMR